MKPFKLSVTQTFTNDQIAGLLCTGFEGGMSSSWIEEVDFKKPTKPAKFKGDWADYRLHSYPLGVGGQVILTDVAKGKKHILDRKALQRGLEVFAKDYPIHFADFISENDDAITGDVFIQCCLFGEVLYG